MGGARLDIGCRTGGGDLGVELVLALLGWYFVGGAPVVAVPRENAPLGSVSHESIRDWVIILLSFSVFLLGFPVLFFSVLFLEFSGPKMLGWNFVLRNRGKLVPERRPRKALSGRR